MSNFACVIVYKDPFFLTQSSHSQIHSFTPGLHFYQRSGLTSNVCFSKRPSQTIQSKMTVSKMCVLSQDAIKQPINLCSHRSGGWKSEIRMSTWLGSGEGCLPFFHMIASPLCPHVVEKHKVLWSLFTCVCSAMSHSLQPMGCNPPASSIH